MGWRPPFFVDYGNLQWTEEGRPVVVPFYNDGPFRDQLAPIAKVVEPAVNNFLGDVICDIAGAAESGYRAIGARNLAASMLNARQRGGCIPPGPGGVNPVPPPFQGGQCPVMYQCRYSYRNTVSGAVLNVANNRMGPISAFFHYTRSTGMLAIIIDSAEGRLDAGSSLFASQNWVANGVGPVLRVDLQPDNCGNLPGGFELPPPVGLPAPPPVGDTIYQPTWVNVDVDEDNRSYSLSVPIGAVIFGGEFGIAFDVGGVGVRIGENGTVQIGPSSGDDGGGYQGEDGPLSLPGLDGIERAIREGNDALMGQLEDVERDLEDIALELSDEGPLIQGAFPVLSCEGELQEFPFSGNGVSGLATQIGAAVSAIIAAPAEVCEKDAGASLGPPELLATGRVPDAREYRVILLDSEIRRVTLHVEPGDYARQYVRAGEGTSGDFGWWAAGPYLDGEVISMRNSQVSLLKQAFDVPESGWAVRLLLYRDVSYSLFGQRPEE